MNPIVITLLKELAKAAIPLVAKKLVDMINDSEKSLPTLSDGSYMNFSGVEIESIINEFKSNDLMTALNNLKKAGYNYNLENNDNTKSLAIFKNGKKLII